MKTCRNNFITEIPIFSTTKIIIVIMTLSPITISAEIYKWVDENGKVHFDDRPGGNKKEKIKMKVKESPAPTDAELEERLAEEQKLLQVFEEERQERNIKKNEEEKKKKKKNKEIKTACAEARDYKKASDGVRIYSLDENGERVYLSDEERETEARELNEFIENNCK